MGAHLQCGSVVGDQKKPKVVHMGRTEDELSVQECSWNRAAVLLVTGQAIGRGMRAWVSSWCPDMAHEE